MRGTLGRFLLWRLAGAVAFVLVVSSTSLLLVRLAPGDAVSDLKLTAPDASVVESARDRLGLNRPAWQQLFAWLWGLPQLDLGTSSRFGRSVGPLVLDRLANTGLLAGLALLIATTIGITLGTASGAWLGATGRRSVGIASVALVACPPILFALLLLTLASGPNAIVSSAPGDLALPLLALGLPLAAVIERLQSRAASDALQLPHIRVAAARGVPNSRLVWVHTLRSSLSPVLGVYGIIIGTLFSGSVAVEVITTWPGIGRLMLDGLQSRDVNLVAGCTLAGAGMIALGNLAADLIRAVVDPRVREAV